MYGSGNNLAFEVLLDVIIPFKFKKYEQIHLSIKSNLDKHFQ